MPHQVWSLSWLIKTLSTKEFRRSVGLQTLSWVTKSMWTHCLSSFTVGLWKSTRTCQLHIDCLTSKEKDTCLGLSFRMVFKDCTLDLLKVTSLQSLHTSPREKVASATMISVTWLIQVSNSLTLRSLQRLSSRWSRTLRNSKKMHSNRQTRINSSACLKPAASTMASRTLEQRRQLSVPQGLHRPTQLTTRQLHMESALCHLTT